MRKLLRYADCLVLLAAIAGCALRMWMDTSGLDSKGLYRLDHPAWMLLILVTVVAAVGFWFISREAGEDSRYKTNFPRSIVGGITYLLLGVVLAYTGIVDFLAAADLLSRLSSLLSMLSAIALATAGIERLYGYRPAFFLHMVPCFYLAVRMFLLGRGFGSQPQILDFLFTFLAALTMIPAFLWLWAFDVRMGKRQQSLFWSLCASFCCLVAVFENRTDWLIHLLFAACLLSNVCALRYLPAPEAQAEAAVEEVPAAEEPSIMDVIADQEETPVEAQAPVEEQTPIEEEAPIEEETPVEETPVEEAPIEEEIPVEKTPIVEEKPARISLSDIHSEDDLDQFLADLRLYLDNEEI